MQGLGIIPTLGACFLPLLSLCKELWGGCGALVRGAGARTGHAMEEVLDERH